MKITIPVIIVIDDDYQLNGNMVNELVNEFKDKVNKIRFNAELAPATDIKFGPTTI